MDNELTRLPLQVLPGVLPVELLLENSVDLLRLLCCQDLHHIPLKHHTVAVEDGVFPVFGLCFAKIDQSRCLRLPFTGRFGSGDPYLPLIWIPLQIVPADDISEDRAELVVRSEEHTSELQSRGHLVC